MNPWICALLLGQFKDESLIWAYANNPCLLPGRISFPIVPPELPVRDFYLQGPVDQSLEVPYGGVDAAMHLGPHLRMSISISVYQWSDEA